MNHLHPASLILLGFALLLAASTRTGAALFLACFMLVLSALVLAQRHFGLILRRSRWLLFTMLVLFGWMTPGTPVPAIPGATLEGLLLAAENLARLLLAIGTVALLLTALPPAALVSGLRTLLAPLVALGVSRDRLAVRLVLTLQEVEASRRGADKDAGAAATSLFLPATGCGVLDLLAGGVAVSLLAVAWLA